jgi:hypothetical protein
MPTPVDSIHIILCSTRRPVGKQPALTPIALPKLNPRVCSSGNDLVMLMDHQRKLVEVMIPDHLLLSLLFKGLK